MAEYAQRGVNPEYDAHKLYYTIIDLKSPLFKNVIIKDILNNYHLDDNDGDEEKNYEFSIAKDNLWNVEVAYSNANNQYLLVNDNRIVFLTLDISPINQQADCIVEQLF